MGGSLLLPFLRPAWFVGGPIAAPFRAPRVFSASRLRWLHLRSGDSTEGVVAMALFFSVASDNGDQQQHQRQHAPALFPPRWGACASEASRGGEDSFTKNVWRRLATGLLAFSAALLRTFGPRGRTPLQATSANGCARPCLFSAVYDCSQWPPLVRAQFYVRTNCPR